MKKQLVLLGMIILFIILSGCNEQTSIENTNDEEETIQDVFFTLSGNITNNYAEEIDIDYIVSAEKYTDWYYSTVDDGATVHLSPYEVKEYSCAVKKGYEKYYFMVSWYYQNGEQGYFTDVNFTNPDYDSVIYHIEVKSNTEMEISKTYHPPNPNKAPKAMVNADPITGLPPLTVSFTGSGTDEDGIIETYHWDFRDGHTSNEQNPVHIFQDAGNYNVKLTVTDDKGATGSDTINIKVEQLAIIDHRAYETYGDTVYVIGLVKNFGDSTVSGIKVTATLYDSSNNIVATEYDYINRGIFGKLKPQEKSGFEIPFWTIYSYDHYDVEITSYSNAYGSRYSDNLVLINVHEEDATGDWFYIKGNIRNSGTEDAEYTSLYANLYDANGKIVGIEWDGLNTIYAGKTSSFSFLITDNYAGDVESYEIEVTCSDL